MKNRNKVIKRTITYVFGLFFLSLGVSFSIQAGLGVSPVSSLAVAMSLTTGESVGITTVIANVLFIIIQIILSKRIDFRDFVVQLIIAFLFGFFMDVTIFLLRFIPTPETMFVKFVYLIISLIVISIGLLGYFTGKFPLMPYDALTHVISERFHLKFSKAKITSDLLNVCVAGALCIVFIKSLGAIGVGTLIAAYFIGKILGWLMMYFQQSLHQWIHETDEGI